MDNSPSRLHDVFFYGLFMDPDILKGLDVEPRNPRISYVEHYKLRIGKKATLLRAENDIAHGILYSLTHDEIYRLYRGNGLGNYESEALMVTLNTEKICALCCNLKVPPADDEVNTEYATRLEATMKRLGVPTECL